MTIRLSCADYAWPALSHEGVLGIIADLGFDGVDIGVFADTTKVTLSSLRRDPRGRAHEVSALLAGVDLVAADVFLTASEDLTRLCPTSRIGDDQAQLGAVFAAILTFAEQLDVRGVTLLPGVVAPGQVVSEAIASAAEGLAPLVAAGAEREVAVSVEPHVGSCIETPAATLELLERCPGLQVTLDPSHFTYLAVSVEDMVALGPRTRHVQLRSAAPGLMQCKLAESTIDLDVLIGGLVDVGYDGWMATEYVWMAKWRCDEVDNVAETAALKRMLESLLAQAPS